MILLDTNVVVAHLNGHAAVTAKISSHVEEIAVPALVVAELDYGAKASTRPTENLARLSTISFSASRSLVSMRRQPTSTARCERISARSANPPGKSTRSLPLSRWHTVPCW